MSPEGDVDGRRVAHVKNPFLGLAATFVHNYIVHLRRYRPTVITTHSQNSELFPVPSLISRRDLGPLDAWINRIGVSLWRRQLAYERFYKRALRAARAHLIHCHFGLSGVYLMPVKRETGLPMVTSFYGVDMSAVPRSRGWEDIYVRSGLFGEGEHFVVEGSHARGTLIRLGGPPERISTVHVGADVQRFPYVERRLQRGDRLVLLFCGRFVRKKGLAHALQAVARLREAALDFEFRVIGYGELYDEVLRLIRELTLERQVRLLGGVTHSGFRRHLLESHVLLAPSLTDPVTGDSEGGAPTVLIEAQATGLPVLSTHHADIPEVVQDGESGVLVPEGDVDGLSLALLDLATHPERWRNLGMAGRAHVERHYNIEIETEKLERVYDAVVESGSARGRSRDHPFVSRRAGKN
ncbi:MAG: glycosyltransferase [Gemmatimonadetes bacterium]|nr:glycosyltransferase [Gemmatimonadota bacterium]